jgi:hypothetical protein
MVHQLYLKHFYTSNMLLIPSNLTYLPIFVITKIYFSGDCVCCHYIWLLGIGKWGYLFIHHQRQSDTKRKMGTEVWGRNHGRIELMHMSWASCKHFVYVVVKWQFIYSSKIFNNINKSMSFSITVITRPHVMFFIPHATIPYPLSHIFTYKPFWVHKQTDIRLHNTIA